MRKHHEMQELTAMENPLIALQTVVDRGGDGEAWITHRIFIDDLDARAFIAPQRHRYPEDEEQNTWRLYAIPADGQLAEVVRAAREAEVRTSELRQMRRKWMGSL